MPPMRRPRRHAEAPAPWRRRAPAHACAPASSTAPTPGPAWRAWRWRGGGFAYRDADGRAVADEETLERIRRLAIPPAWTGVWICPLADGHLQATGRDARGRKQYRYHAGWQALRGEDKFERLEAFGRALPRIRARVARDLRPAAAGRRATAPAVGRELLLATIVRLLDTTFVRVGNEQYARQNRSYGLTTLRNRHAGVSGETLRLKFRGKSGVMQQVELHDRRVAAVVRRCQRLPGQELFQYEDEAGGLHRIDSGDVNDYLAAIAGGDFTAKDFRTWHGSVLALELTRLACGRCAAGDDGCEAARFSAQAVLAQVASRLGNTPAVCRKAYVHPAVLELGSRLAADAAEMARFAAGSGGEAVPPRSGLSAAERRFAAFLGRPGGRRAQRGTAPAPRRSGGGTAAAAQRA